MDSLLPTEYHRNPGNTTADDDHASTNDHGDCDEQSSSSPAALTPLYAVSNSLNSRISTASATNKNSSKSAKSRVKRARRPPSLKLQKAPDAPKRFKSAFIFFTIEMHPKVRKQMEEDGVKDYKTPDVAKIVSEKWRALTPSERAVWDEKARLDKERFMMEKSTYKGPWKVLSVQGDGRRDPSAPKRPMSSFLSYSNGKRAAVKAKNPHFTNADISKKLAQMWKDAPPQEKEIFNVKAAALREEYKKDMAEWKSKNKTDLRITDLSGGYDNDEPSNSKSEERELLAYRALLEQRQQTQAFGDAVLAQNSLLRSRVLEQNMAPYHHDNLDYLSSTLNPSNSALGQLANRYPNSAIARHLEQQNLSSAFEPDPYAKLLAAGRGGGAGAGGVNNGLEGLSNKFPGGFPLSSSSLHHHGAFSPASLLPQSQASLESRALLVALQNQRAEAENLFAANQHAAAYGLDPLQAAPLPQESMNPYITGAAAAAGIPSSLSALSHQQQTIQDHMQRASAGPLSSAEQAMMYSELVSSARRSGAGGAAPPPGEPFPDIPDDDVSNISHHNSLGEDNRE